jgi:hypothetical protein
MGCEARWIRFARALDSLPPEPPAFSVNAPGDIYPRGSRERELCAVASRPDWLYLGGLVVLDAGSIWFDSWETTKYSASLAVRLRGPAAVGVTWGATIGGAWLSLPKCSPEWVGEMPREGQVREHWPLALSLALLAGVTAPVINGIAIGPLPDLWTTPEREAHLVVAGVTAFGAALLPYLLPPTTWAAARELDRIRFGADPHGAFVGYTRTF